MALNSKSIRGGSNITLNITNDDVNASWQTVTADSITSTGNVYANSTVNLLDKINTKQDIISGATDLTVKDLTSNSIANATTLTTASLTATGNISTSSGTLSASGDITSSAGSIIADNIAIDTDLINTDSGSNLIAFGHPQNGSNGFRIKDLYLNNVNGFINETGVCLGESEGGHLDGGDFGMMICCDTSVQAGRNGYIGFADVNTSNKQGLIDYDFQNDRLNLYADGIGSHKISIRSAVIDFSEQIRGNNGLYLQGSNGITVVSGGDIINSSGNIRSTTGDIYAESGNVAIGKVPDGTAPLDVVGNIEASGTINCDTLTCSSLTIDNDVLHVDSTNDRLGINTTSPESSLQIVGARQGVPTTVGVHIGHSSATNYGIELCSDATASSGIDFTKPNSNRRGAIGYNNSTEVMSFTVNNGVQLTLANAEANFQDNNIITTGDLTVDSDVLHVDSTNDRVGIGTTSPESALHILGPRLTTPTAKGVHLGHGSSSDAYGIEVCSAVDSNSVIDFTEEGSDYRGRILYNPSLERFDFSANGGLQLVLSNNEANFQDQLIRTTGAVNCGDLNVTGSISGFSLQDIYDDNDVEPHITINPSHPVTFQGHASVTNVFQCRDAVGTNVFEVARDGHMTCVDADVNGELTVIGDLNVDTNTFHVDSINNGVSIGTNLSTNVPQCALSVYGGYITTAPTQKGIHMSLETDDTPIINMCSDSESTGKIQFNQAGSNKGGITYNHSDNGMQFEVENSVLMDLSTSQTMVYGDFTVDTNSFHVDSSNNRVGIGTGSPLSALHVVGNRDNSPASVGVHMGATGNGSDYGIEVCSPANEQMLIDFCTSSGANDYQTRLMYDDSGNYFQISTANKEIRIDSGTADIDLNGDVIIESGKTLNGNLNSTRGQIMSFLGEESSRLAVNAFDFKWGNGQSSSANFGVCVPGDIRLKRWVYQNNAATGTAFTTGTKIVFRVWSNGVGTGNYIYCDFSDTGRSNTTRRRCQGRFSSSSTSYVAVTNTISDAGDGSQISLQTITLTGPGSTNNDHRISLFFETVEDM